jgi:signal transduction histidine kinase
MTEEPAKPEKQLTPQAARVLNRYMAEFFSETRTPLMGIIGYSEVMLEGEDKIGPLTETQRQGLTYIHQSAKAVLKFWEFFFDLYHITYGYWGLYIESVELSKLIQEAISDIQVEQNLPHDLPNIWIDRKRVQQALILVLEAITDAVYPREGSTITLTVNYDNNSVMFYMAAVGKEKIYFLDDPDDPTLFFSRSIIEMHGGQMQVNVQEELKRLEISFTLPIHQNKPHPE